MSCEQCIKESPIHRKLSHLPQQNPKENTTAPEYAIQMDLEPELQPFGGY